MKNRKKCFNTNVDSETGEKFKKIADGLDKNPSQFLREFIMAAVEDRVKITPKITEVHNKIYT